MKEYRLYELLKPIIVVYEIQDRGKRHRYKNIMVFSAYEARAILDLIEDGGKYEGKDFVYFFDEKKSLLRLIDRRSGEEVLCHEVDRIDLIDTLLNFVDVDLPFDYGDGL